MRCTLVDHSSCTLPVLGGTYFYFLQDIVNLETQAQQGFRAYQRLYHQLHVCMTWLAKAI